MELAIVRPDMFIGALIFYVGFLYLFYRFRQAEEGFGDFSVGISYRDVFALLVTIVPLVAGFTYLLMALGLGFVTVDGREVAYLKYFDWMVTGPILLFAIGMVAQDARRTVTMMVVNVVLVALGFLTTLVAPPLETMLVMVVMGALIWLFHILVVQLGRQMDDRPQTARRLYRRLRDLTVAVWALFVVIGFLSPDTLGVLSTDMMGKAYLVMDIISKLGYGLIVVMALRTEYTLSVSQDG